MATPPEVVERALLVRALTTSAREASMVLAEKYELTVAERTLQQWVSDTHRDRYEAIRANVAPKIRAAIASECEDLAEYITRVEREAVERVENTIATMDGKDAAVALKALSSAKSSALDKALVLRGQASSITESRSPAEIIRAMAALGVTVVDPAAGAVESTAVEIDPAGELEEAATQEDRSEERPS